MVGGATKTRVSHFLNLSEENQNKKVLVGFATDNRAVLLPNCFNCPIRTTRARGVRVQSEKRD
jgi:hypothetical protein